MGYDKEVGLSLCEDVRCLCVRQMWALQDNMKDFVLALQDTLHKTSKCPADVSHGSLASGARPTLTVFPPHLLSSLTLSSFFISLCHPSCF